MRFGARKALCVLLVKLLLVSIARCVKILNDSNNYDCLLRFEMLRLVNSLHITEGYAQKTKN